MAKFKVGDRVQYVKPGSHLSGRSGVITFISSGANIASVRMDDNGTSNIAIVRNLELMETATGLPEVSVPKLQDIL